MEDSKDCHLNAEKHRRYANFDVGSLNFRGLLDGTGACQERDEERLPETEENDEFDGENLKQRLMLRNVASELDIELDDAVHGYSDGDCFDYQDPYVSKGWVKRL